MMNIETGELCVEGNEYKIDPTLSKDVFLESKYGREAQEIVANQGWSTFKVEPYSIGEQVFLVSITFFKNRLFELVLMRIEPNESRNWSDYTVQYEKERKIKHDEYLNSQFGRPPYKFSWGEIMSVFDEKSGASIIIIRYKRNMLIKSE